MVVKLNGLIGFKQFKPSKGKLQSIALTIYDAFYMGYQKKITSASIILSIDFMYFVHVNAHGV